MELKLGYATPEAVRELFTDKKEPFRFFAQPGLQ